MATIVTQLIQALTRSIGVVALLPEYGPGVQHFFSCSRSLALRGIWIFGVVEVFLHRLLHVRVVSPNVFL